MDGAARNNFGARVACGPMKTHDVADMMFAARRHLQQNVKGAEERRILTAHRSVDVPDTTAGQGPNC